MILQPSKKSLPNTYIFEDIYLLNADIISLSNSFDVDFKFSAESGTVWIYSDNWYNSGDIVPDQVSPANDAMPLVDSGAGVAGVSTEYSRGDHQHLLQVSTTLRSKDTSVGSVGYASTYARFDYQHPIQITDSIPPSGTAEGMYGSVAAYARNNHTHPKNVEDSAATIPTVIRVRYNDASAKYARHGHVYIQQLSYDGNLTVTKFIKAGGLATVILCANGENFVQKTALTLQMIEDLIRKREDDEESIDDDYFARKEIADDFVSIATNQTINGIKTFEKLSQVNPSVNDSFNESIRISRHPINQWSNIQFGSDLNSNIGYIDNQWLTGTIGNNVSSPFEFIIVKAGQEGQSDWGLQISADGNILKFNKRTL
ncbi:MAG: hypothetical protein EZS28_001968 [Streblomastix strix]|uniref:Uncharacterized protein n=1 Tax=Streblomastix strix TaxID=222440 RepID=A0A5J4X6K0_9EUKA|nr:MAG: hypothetical protein EZS28_001968 [Streblomastix strix]